MKEAGSRDGLFTVIVNGAGNTRVQHFKHMSVLLLKILSGFRIVQLFIEWMMVLKEVSAQFVEVP